MPTLQSSGAISINDIKALFGGPASPSLSDYYRGGAYVPAVKSVTTRDPVSGQNYQTTGSLYYWIDQGEAYWNNTQVSANTGTSTSFTNGGYTYYKGSLRESIYHPATGYTPAYTTYYYDIYRTSVDNNVAINSNVPASGQISLTQFYGAEKP